MFKKKMLLATVIATLLLLNTQTVSAHPGRTDANGGHTCRTNCAQWGLKDGEYHKHDGIKTETPPAHTVKPSESDATEKLTLPTKGKLSVYFLNVGQGDATYIKTANGDDILIDGGNNKYGDSVVAYLKQLKVDDIEVLISTHPDADHIGGLDTVLESFKVEAVYAPKISHTTDTFRDFLTAVKAEKLTIKEAKAGIIIPLKGVTAKFVAPVTKYAVDDLNNWSAVLKLTNGNNTFLFMGDAEMKSEGDMIKAKTILNADVLKVGHHGAKTSSSAAFLKAVAPKYAVISVGKNSYGHPTSEVLNALKKAKATVYRTDINGTVLAVSDGKTITFTKVKK